MRSNFLRSLLLTTTAIAAGGCSTGQADRTGQSTQGFFAPSFESLWDIGDRALRAAAFRPDPEESSRQTKTMVSRHNVQLSPFSFKGYRDQATVYFHPVEGRENYYTVEANVVRQLNKNMKEPLVHIRAEWDAGTRIPESERMIVHSIETFFIGRDVSPELRQRYDMGPGRTVIPAPAPANPDGSVPKAAK